MASVFEIREARIDRLPPLGVHRRKRGRVVALHLRQMTHHVAQRDEAVLDVVIDLPSQIADGGAVFGLAHAGGAAAQSRRELAEQPRQRADFVSALVELDVEPIEIEDGRLLGQSGERPADAGGHPHRQHERGDAGAGGRRQKPGVGAPHQRF